jgi:hypothetical protein
VGSIGLRESGKKNVFASRRDEIASADVCDARKLICDHDAVRIEDQRHPSAICGPATLHVELVRPND